MMNIAKELQKLAAKIQANPVATWDKRRNESNLEYVEYILRRTKNVIQSCGTVNNGFSTVGY